MAANTNRRERAKMAMAAYRSLICAAETMVATLEQHLTPIGLTTAQYRALEALLLHGSMSQTELCQFTFTGSSSTSLTLRILQRHRLVTRRVDERHHKRNVVTITELGKRLMAENMPHHVKLVRALMAVLGRRGQELLTRLCDKLSAGDEAKLLRELLRTMRGR